ncbi:hypothetical protein [Ideonella livida]|uniref:Uncharacterized protein n=1 Tax=Ideonella livida TaxID=2707176 RepID=A0A7C9PG88_9BURK|nr:hypothetical protein [Ideonella livida]NDY91177.1 hypothetical protein [Ideonella livida]
MSLRRALVPLSPALALFGSLGVLALLAAGGSAQAQTAPRLQSWGVQVSAADLVAQRVSLTVMDGQADAPVRSTTLVPLWEGQVPAVVTSAHEAMSATQQRRLGDAQLLYLKGGKIWRRDLRADAPQGAGQVGSLADACSLQLLGDRSLHGRSSLLLVRRKAGAADCTEPRRVALVASNDASTTAARTLSADRVLVEALRGSNGLLQHLLLWSSQTQTLSLHDLQLNWLADVAQGLTVPPTPLQVVSGSVSYYQDGTKLRRLTRTAQGGVWSGALATGTVKAAAARGGQLFYALSRSVYRVSPQGTPTLLATLTGSITDLRAGTSRLAVAVYAAGEVLWHGLPQSGGGAVRLLPAVAAPVQVLGLDGDSLYLAAGNAGLSVPWDDTSVHRAPLSGASPVKVVSGVGAVGLVQDPVRTLWQADRLAGLTYCVPWQVGQPCNIGTVRERRWGVSGSTLLGQIDQPASSGLGGGTYWADQPLVMPLYGGAGQQDLWLGHSGVAGSLQRITHHVP